MVGKTNTSGTISVPIITDLMWLDKKHACTHTRVSTCTHVHLLRTSTHGWEESSVCCV